MHKPPRPRRAKHVRRAGCAPGRRRRAGELRRRRNDPRVAVSFPKIIALTRRPAAAAGRLPFGRSLRPAHHAAFASRSAALLSSSTRCPPGPHRLAAPGRLTASCSAHATSSRALSRFSMPQPPFQGRRALISTITLTHIMQLNNRESQLPQNRLASVGMTNNEPRCLKSHGLFLKIAISYRFRYFVILITCLTVSQSRVPTASRAGFDF